MYGSVQIVFEPKNTTVKADNAKHIESILQGLTVESIIGIRGKVGTFT
jgi:hypothetical protein